MKCFYHSSDLDGHCSGAIVKARYPECEMIGINYGEKIDLSTIQPNEVVFMVDFCLYPFYEMEALNEVAELHWIDHHATAIDDAYASGFLASGGQLLEVDKAACELTWLYLCSNLEMPKSVFLLGRYDVWDHDAHPDVLAFQYGMRLFKDTRPTNTFLWLDVLATDIIFQYSADNIVDKGRCILEYEANQSAKFCKAYAFETQLMGLPAICANRGFTNSKLFDSVYDPNKHKLMITFSRLPKDKAWAVSLYSTHEDVDCGKLARTFAGGGHKGAAGFSCIDIPFEY